MVDPFYLLIAVVLLTLAYAIAFLDRWILTLVVEPVKALKNPVSLARIKSEERLSGWDLVRMSRLSVMPVTPDQWKIVEELARETG